MKTNATMKLIMTSYPGFHDLPKGVKQMLQVSESFFFESEGAAVKRSVPPSQTVAAMAVVEPMTTTGSALTGPRLSVAC